MGVPRSRLVSVGVRVDVVVPRSDGGVLCSGVVFVCRRLRHHTLRRIPSFAPTAPGCRVGGCPAGRARCGVEGTQRAVGWMSGDHDRCFSTLVPEAFRQVFFNANATVHHHRRRLVGRIGHHDRCSLTLVLVYSARRHGVCLGVYV